MVGSGGSGSDLSGKPLQRQKQAALFLRLTRVFALGKFSGALEHYEQQIGDDDTRPTVADVIAALGGQAMMDRIRTEKTADDRYPQAMLRLRRLIAELPPGDFHELFRWKTSSTGASLGMQLNPALLPCWPEPHGDNPGAMQWSTARTTIG